MRDSRLFDQAVKNFFEPIAQKLRLPISKVREGAYEIVSPYFIMRIRLHTGHRRGLNVLLRPASIRGFDENTPGTEYGIANFMVFAGGVWIEQLIETDADFLERAEWLAGVSERFGVPYLLGEGKDLDAIEEIIRSNAEKHVKLIKSYCYPEGVRQEWTPTTGGE
jgi:hypothetical protein